VVFSISAHSPLLLNMEERIGIVLAQAAIKMPD
jgi:hypothetical protein